MNENDLTDENASETYMRLVQVVDGEYYDGLGNKLDISNNTQPSNTFNIDGGSPSSINTNRVFKIDFGGIL